MTSSSTTLRRCLARRTVDDFRRVGCDVPPADVPDPILNPATPQTGGTLALAGIITLDPPVRDVQGATFVDATRILCSTNDANTDLWPTPRQLLQVDLAGPLTGTAVTAQVTLLGELPTESLCPGTFEVEGIEFESTSGDFRVEVVPPSLCRVLTTIYRFRQV
jgi:hypothetical protein